MTYYQTLPTTNSKVEKLFHDLGYTHEVIKEKYRLTVDVVKALHSGMLAFYNNDFHITFYPGSDKKKNDA